MNNGPKLPKSRSMRLKDYDYSQNGAYFVTICAHNKEMLFENSQIKKIIELEWLKTPELRHGVFLDKFVVMPNHLHGIIIIERRVGAYRNTPLRGNIIDSSSGMRNTPLRGKFISPSQTLGAIIRGFKAASTLKINIFRNTPGKPVWQRNYYDHIIRNEMDLSEKKKYIRENSHRWTFDGNNPVNFQPEGI